MRRCLLLTHSGLRAGCHRPAISADARLEIRRSVRLGWGRHLGTREESMSVILRPGAPTDAAMCGPICFEAFKAINDTHHFPPDFPSPEVATALLGMLLSHP